MQLFIFCLVFIFVICLHVTRNTSIQRHLAQVCGPFVDIYRGLSLEIAVMGHIVQHTTFTTYPHRFKMATMVEVNSRVFTPIVLKAGLVLMTSSSETATNGFKDPRVADGHPAGSRDLQGDSLFHL